MFFVGATWGDAVPVESGLATGAGAVQVVEVWPLAQHLLQINELVVVVFLA
jgi:hypothetical protein